RAVRRARRADPRGDERRAPAHLAGAAQDRAVRHPFDLGSGVPGRPGAGDDAAARPHRRRAERRLPAAAQPRRDDDRGVRVARAAHPRRAQCRRGTRMRGQFRGFVLRLVLIAATLAVWEALVRLFAIPAFILPTPSSIFTALYRGLASFLYVDHFGITL